MVMRGDGLLVLCCVGLAVLLSGCLPCFGDWECTATEDGVGVVVTGPDAQPVARFYGTYEDAERTMHFTCGGSCPQRTTAYMCDTQGASVRFPYNIGSYRITISDATTGDTTRWNISAPPIPVGEEECRECITEIVHVTLDDGGEPDVEESCTRQE